MGTNLLLLLLPCPSLGLCAQFRRQEVLWGQTAAAAEGKPPPVLFIGPYLSIPVGNRWLSPFMLASSSWTGSRQRRM